MRLFLTSLIIASTMFLAGGARSADNEEAPFYKGIDIVSSEYSLSSTSDPNARCRTSTVTQKRFLNMVRAIAEHGDLTDKDFIEKTLQIKLELANKKFRPGTGFYRADMPNGKFGDPIQVILDPRASYIAGAGTQKGEELSFWGLDMVGAVFHNCQYLTKKQFQREFADVFRDEVEKQSGAVDLGKVGKNGSDIQISYYPSSHSFSTPKDALMVVTIFQKSQFIPNN